MNLGIDKSAMVRVRAGISYALTEAMDEGHCGLPTDDLVPLAERLLEVPQELVWTALDLELADGAVIADMVGDKPCVFLAGLYRAEVFWPKKTPPGLPRCSPGIKTGATEVSL